MVRGKQVTVVQQGLMLDFMENNPCLLKGKLTAEFTKIKKKEMWVTLCDLLNADGSGPLKTVEKWAKTWQDWRSLIKKKAQRIQQHARGTGGGPPCDEELSALENRLITCIGVVAIEGNADIEEGGLGPADAEEMEVDNDFQVDVAPLQQVEAAARPVQAQGFAGPCRPNPVVEAAPQARPRAQAARRVGREDHGEVLVELQAEANENVGNIYGKLNEVAVVLGNIDTSLSSIAVSMVTISNCVEKGNLITIALQNAPAVAEPAAAPANNSE